MVKVFALNLLEIKTFSVFVKKLFDDFRESLYQFLNKIGLLPMDPSENLEQLS